MATTLETLALGLDARRMKEGAQQAKRALDSVGDEAERTSRRLKQTQQGVKSLRRSFISLRGAIATLGVGLAVRQSLREFARFEQIQIGLETLIGSATEANQVLTELEDFASRTPFRLPGLAENVRLLSAMGFETEELVDTVKILSDTTAAFGESEATMQRIARALGQMRARGRLATEEMNQLVEVGVNGFQALADATGRSIAEVRDATERGLLSGAVAAEIVLNDLQRRYEGAAARQAQTLEGVWSTFGDEVGRTFRGIGGLLSEVVNPALKEITGVLAEVNKALFQTQKLLLRPIPAGAPRGLQGFPEFERGFPLENFFRNRAAPILRRFDAEAQNLIEIQEAIQRILDDPNAFVAGAFRTRVGEVIGLTGAELEAFGAKVTTELERWALADQALAGLRQEALRTRIAMEGSLEPAIIRTAFDLLTIFGNAGSQSMEQVAEATESVEDVWKRLTNTMRQARSEAEAVGPFIGPVEPPPIVPADFLQQMRAIEQEALQRNLALAEAIAAPFENAFASIISGTKSVSGAFADMAQDILSSLASIFVRRGILNPFINSLFSLSGSNALPTFAQGGILSGASAAGMHGGIVSSPVAIAGEAGPEAVLPLKRSRDGTLGVAASGGSGAGVTQNFYIQSPDVSGFRRSQRQIQRDMRKGLAG